MKRLILKIILLSLVVSQSVSFAQSKFMFDADYSLFRYTDSKSVLEVYFDFYQNSFKYVYENNYFVAHAVLGFQLTDADTKTDIINKEFRLNLSTTDTTSTKLKTKEISQVTFFIEANKNYSLVLIGSDDNSPVRRDTLKFSFSVPAFTIYPVKASSIQLSTSIEKSANKESSFYKFGVEVVPNPNALFGNTLKSLHYYYELYGFKSFLEGADASLNTFVTGINGDTVLSATDVLKGSNDVMSLNGVINVDTMKSGSYLLNVCASRNGEVVAKTEKKFFVFNTGKTNYAVTDEEGYLKSEFVTYGEQAIDDEFDKALYLRTAVEKNEFEKLKSVDEKRKFLYKFWRKRDTKPETPRIEVRDEFIKRFREANSKFKQSFSEGWRSDRGRIYIIYGPPTEIERHYMEANTKNYEIWTYDNVEGGTMCVFGETVSSEEGSYYLMHSTIKNELYDIDWKEKLRKM
ncbi:MAG: GWxTD domain-containing protein [Ignavibacteria bacterium]